MACTENETANAAEITKVTDIQKMIAEKIIKMPSDNNPIVAHRFCADPAVLIYKDTVYIYSTNDHQQLEYSKGNDNNTYGKINSLNLCSSKDLVNWTDLGVIPVAGRNGGNGPAKWANNSWAPAVAWKNIDGKDKFFLYFADNGSGIGVLTADSPEGPFIDPLGKQLISRQTPNCANVNWLFDPAVFIDDDGKGYIYFGGGHDQDKFEHPMTGRCAALGDDMISIVGEPQTIDAPYLFEDSGINKINNLYYYTYCTNWVGRTETATVPPVGVIGYMTSEKPLGPFEYKGYTFKNPSSYFGAGAGGNNHHWIFEFKGKHYIAFHAPTPEKMLKLPKTGYRSLYIADFKVNEDGSLPYQTATSAGVEPVCNFDIFAEVPVATFHSVKKIAITSKRTLEAVEDGGYVCIKGADFADGAKKVVLDVVSDGTKGALKIVADNLNGIVLADVKIGKKAQIEEKLASVSGVHDVYFVFTGNFELTGWKFLK